MNESGKHTPGELLPCPFCGGGAYVNYSDRGELFGVRCNDWHGNGGSIKCMGAGAYADTEAEAIAAWNRRSFIPVLDDAAIERACRAHAPHWDKFGPDIQFYARQQMRAACAALTKAGSPT